MSLCFWIITDHPSDFPEHYVLRTCFSCRYGLMHSMIGGLYDSIEEARADLPPGLFKLCKNVGDDPVIAETWM